MPSSCGRRGRTADAVALADATVARFPDSGYARFIRGVIAIFDADLDCAAATIAAGTSSDVMPLQVLVMFMRMVGAMTATDRAAAVGQFLHRNAPTSYLVDLGIAAAVGEAGLAMEHLLATVRSGRRLGFAAENDGRGVPDSHILSGLFMPNGEIIRRDPRFAEVCVRLGLYDCWRETGLWPDCAAELAPIYDLRSECARLATTVERYDARGSSVAR